MSEIVERVLKVFEDKKLFGKQQEWGVEVANGAYVLFPGRYCCGIGALLLGVENADHDMDQEVAAVQLLGMNPGYVEGYMAGFDGSEPPSNPENEYAIGFEDGRSTWNALVKKNRVWVSEDEVEREMKEPDYDDGP